ncbi:MAG: SDR family oxidoreductase [Burkholderiales bacterium]|nr:SDR family oxidoreductase [Burkholderiales bacterium]
MNLKQFDLSGRRALVTGSSQGIGLALAKGLAEAGAAVVLNGRDVAKLERARQQFPEPQQVALSAFDVTDEKAVEAAIASIESDLGAIDILVNNAGMTIRNPLQDFQTADWHRIMATNLTSAFLVGRTVARRMIPRQRGKIVNICSVNSEAARYSIAPYTASKGALKNLTKGMCVDWARHGIQANALAPGYFETELTRPLVENAEFTAWLKNRTPAQRWGNVAELTGAMVFLASSASDFVNGHVLYVDGGMLAGL